MLVITRATAANDRPGRGYSAQPVCYCSPEEELRGGRHDLVSSTCYNGKGSPNYVDLAKKLAPEHLDFMDAYCEDSHMNKTRTA